MLDVIAAAGICVAVDTVLYGRHAAIVCDAARDCSEVYIWIR